MTKLWPVIGTKPLLGPSFTSLVAHIIIWKLVQALPFFYNNNTMLVKVYILLYSKNGLWYRKYEPEYTYHFSNIWHGFRHLVIHFRPGSKQPKASSPGVPPQEDRNADSIPLGMKGLVCLRGQQSHLQLHYQAILLLLCKHWCLWSQVFLRHYKVLLVLLPQIFLQINGIQMVAYYVLGIKN